MSESSQTVAAGGDRWFEALDWYTQLQEARETELPHDKIHAWQEWLAVDQNRIVFDQLSQLMEDGPHCRKRSLPSSVDIHSDRYEPTISSAAHRHTVRTTRQPVFGQGAHRTRTTDLLRGHRHGQPRRTHEFRGRYRWSQGRLEFDHEPLRYIVEIVNRYTNRKIVAHELF
jgi:ferric-dicitrate binding protein FerR (iron transport regulator)